MKKTKKALASLAIAGMSLSMIPFNVFAASTVPTRIAGVTAEQTAVQIAEQTGYTGAAILASSTSYGMVDALTAGPLAASLKAPILLTGAGNTLDAATKAELTKLAVKTVYVTSGTAVIKQGVIDELKAMGITVEQLGGIDRAATSVNIAKKMTGVTKVAVANTVVDALSIASVASAANQPILLTDRDALPASVSAYLAANAGITASDVIGGTGVISDAVKAGLPGATRHAGMSAYDTNNQVIQDFAAALSFENVFVANGVTGIDALAGAPLAAKTKSPIVLTDGKTVPAVAQFTFSKAPVGAVVTALGGEFVVPESVRDGVAKGQVTPDSNKLEIVSVSALDDTNKYLEIVFSKAVSGLQTSDITVKNADTAARYGIKEVQMSSNGLTATVELYSQDDDEQVLAYLQDYVVTVNANGTVITKTFNRPYSFKVRVQDINVGDKEIVAYVDKGNNAGTKVTLDVPENLKFDYEGALGELVQVWYNGDNELVNFKVLSSTAKADSIEVTADDEIKLLGEDKKYDISTEAYSTSTSNKKFAFYVDGEEVDMDDYVGDKFNFAKVGFDTAGDIEFVSAYSLKDVVLVESVDGDEVVGIDGSGGFDAEDATIVKGGKVIDVADLKKGDLLFYSDDADDEDGYAEVLNDEIASGEIEEVYDDAIEVDGETYNYVHEADDFEYNNGTAIYVNEDGDVDNVDSDAAESLQAAGDVTLYGDYAGNLIYIGGDTALVEGNAKVAVLTKDILGYSSARDKVEIEALTQDEDEVSYDMDLEDFDTITVDGTEYDIDNASGADSDWSADLIGTAGAYTGIRLSDNENVEADVDVLFNNEADAGSLVKLHLDDDGNLEELEFFSDANGLVGVGTVTSVEAGDKYIDGKKLLSSTLMFDATEDQEDTDADDYVVSTFGDYEGSEIDNGTYIYNDDAEVVAIWYSSTTSDDKSYDEAVVTKVLRNTDDEIVSVTVYAGGAEKTLKVDEVTANDVKKGQVVILEFDEDNMELVKGFARTGHDIDANYSSRVKPAGSVATNGVDVGNKTVTVGGVTYKLADNGLVLDASDTSDITEESLSDLRGESNVTVVLDAKTGLYAKLFVIGASSATTPITTTGVVTYIDNSNIAIDNVVYTFSASSVLYNATGTVIATGGSAINVSINPGDVLQNVNVTGGVVTSIKVKTLAAVEAGKFDALVVAFTGTGTQAQVTAARTAYDALTAGAKALVTPANLTTLVLGEDTLAAAHVDALIAAFTLPNATQAQVTAARTAYDALSAAAKVLVNAGGTTNATIQTEEAKLASASVNTQLAALPAEAAVTLANKSAIVAARTAYNNLTPTQAAQVLAANVTLLNEAERAVTDLEAATALIATAKTDLTTLVVNDGAGTIAKPANHANGATYTLTLGTLPTFTTGSVAGVNPVTIVKDAAGFTFDITVTIALADNGATVADESTITATKVFKVTVPNTVAPITVVAK